jgi:cytosine/adenosine deaminase-related metal-dependent hydrolase
MGQNTRYKNDLIRFVKQKGGAINAHAHLDRADTLDKRYLSHIGLDPMEASSYPLRVKQNMVGDLHRGPAYTEEDLRKRMRKNLDAMSRYFNVREVWSLVDTSADIGRVAFDVAIQLKEEMKDKIDFRVGSYPIFGFEDGEPQRWRIFEETSREADFLGALPERDERKGHVGYKEHLRRILHLAAELGKPVDVHVDQANDPMESGTEELIHAVNYCIPPSLREKDMEPLVWAVHAISPSAYDEKRFRDLLDGLKDCNIGVKYCPRAAVSMKQDRGITAPSHNSSARVLEMMAKRIPARLGSDNIGDVFVPTGSPDVYQEATIASDVLRFYNPEIWAKVLAGEELNEMDRYKIESSIRGR